MTFDKIYNQIDKSLLLCTKAEIEELYKLASMVQGNVVELGSMYGMSGAVIEQALTTGNLTCVEGFFINGEDCRREFAKIIKKARLMDMTTNEASKIYNDEIDLLFIDADHQEHSIIEDCNNWIPKVKSGGYVAFHDYNNLDFLAVKKNVDILTDGWRVYSEIDTLLVKIKP